MAAKKRTRKKAPRTVKPRRRTKPPRRAKATREAKRKPASRAQYRDEFLILKISEASKVGSSLSLVGVAESLDKAKKFLQTLAGGTQQRFAIVEKKAIVERKPAVTVELIARENIVKD